MKCPLCIKEGLKSRIYVGGSQTTLMYAPSYYDEDGNYHHNDPNTTYTDYECSNGHRWTVSSFQGEETIKTKEKK